MATASFTLTRRQSLQTMAGVAASLWCGLPSGVARADDVAWLDDVRPQPSDEALQRFSPLLKTASGKTISTVEEWEKHRETIRKQWLDFLGPMPARNLDLNIEIVSEERVGGVLRQLVHYDVEEGYRAPGYLLTPIDDAGGKKRPAIVGLHQTTNSSIDEIAGVSGPEDMHIGLKMARQGFVVFCPKNYLWHDVENYQQAVARHAERHPKTLGMMKMLYDAQRGVDVLCALDGVDTDRIGAMGHSLGAKETFYLMAFDERIKAGVASDGGTAFDSTNWNAPWYLGKGIEAPDFPLDHHELIALIAPRSFLIIAGEIGSAADGDRSLPYLQAALPVWELYDNPVRLGIYNHRMGHVLPPKIYARLEEWLKAYV